MTEHFNKLTPAEVERLALLAEECGEVIQVIGKILRHGYESYHPEGNTSNRELLALEVSDVMAALVLMQELDPPDIEPDEIEASTREKAQQLKKYLHHQEEIDTP